MAFWANFQVRMSKFADKKTAETNEVSRIDIKKLSSWNILLDSSSLLLHFWTSPKCKIFWMSFQKKSVHYNKYIFKNATWQPSFRNGNSKKGHQVKWISLKGRTSFYSKVILGTKYSFGLLSHYADCFRFDWRKITCLVRKFQNDSFWRGHRTNNKYFGYKQRHL